ncbi:M56 family metallopeptidase [Mitsuaria sp. WAJ17]|uniref:M56 family metallopeptidase n=1 Tax=Mitsuaria sp. WAJ17 TaxID=2761452 RepID=UPI001601A1A8|nr:M56 family metallopeptidase [Mitsuaria sp. WAJ17]MBB2484408.1 M56 family metallopeptidase [Mitsuaria sp. WAJ17]
MSPVLPWLEASAVLHGLARSTAFLSLALLLLGLLRPLLMRAAGPRAVHAAWIALPLGLLGLLLPAPTAQPHLAVLSLAQSAAQLPWRAEPASAQGEAWPALLVLGWLSGVAALLLLQWRAHGRVLQQLDRRALPWRSQAGCSPALIGLWRPRLVLPADFEQRFTPAEQALVLGHEAAHARRGDNAWTLLARTLACLHWFNPLAWWALHRFAQDQELACDALVLQQASAQDLAHYAHALLKAGQAPDAEAAWPALAASWQDCHPLKRRILMLKTHPLHAPRRWRARLGAGLCVALLTGLGYGVQAQDQQAAATTVDLSLTVHEGAALLGQPRLLVHEGQAAAVEFSSDTGEQSGPPLRIGITTWAEAGDRYHMLLKLEQGQPLTLVAQPRLSFKAGQPIRVDVNEAGRALRIDILAQPLPPGQLPVQKTAAL